MVARSDQFLFSPFLTAMQLLDLSVLSTLDKSEKLYSTRFG